MLAQRANLFPSHLVRIIAGYRRYVQAGKLIEKPLLEFASNVVGGRDEVTKDDWMIALAQQTPNRGNRLQQLVVSFGLHDGARFAGANWERRRRSPSDHWAAGSSNGAAAG